MTRRFLQFALILVAVCYTLATPAYAQTFGVRVGGSADPDQFFVGGHFETPRLGDTKQFALRPNVELGFFNHVVTVTGNMEMVYWMAVPSSSLSAYIGGGPAVNYYHSTENGGGGGGVHGGLSALVGFQATNGIFAEMKVGITQPSSPSLKFAVGYVFKKS